MNVDLTEGKPESVLWKFGCCIVVSRFFGARDYRSMMGRFMASTFSDLILRVVFAVLLSKTFLGATGIWCAWPIGWAVATQGFMNYISKNLIIVIIAEKC